jgi:hypothetical protein
MFSTIGSTKRDSSVTDIVSGVGISSQFESIEMGGVFFYKYGMRLVVPLKIISDR